jgi:hypothetical protein
MQTGYAYLWEFQVRRGREAEFERHYAAGGTWAQLFHRSPSYIETLLLKDSTVAGRYVTLDRWRDEAGYREFRSAFAQAYAKLDEECEQLTVAERSLGTFSEWPAPGRN